MHSSVVWGRRQSRGWGSKLIWGWGWGEENVKMQARRHEPNLVGLRNCEAAPVRLFSSQLWAPVEPWCGFWVGPQCAAPKQLFVTVPAAEAAQAVANESEGKHAFFVLSLDAFAQPLWETASAWQCSNKKARQGKPEC